MKPILARSWSPRQGQESGGEDAVGAPVGVWGRQHPALEVSGEESVRPSRPLWGPALEVSGEESMRPSRPLWAPALEVPVRN